MDEADGIVLEAMLDDVLTPDVLDEAAEQALQTILAERKQPGGNRSGLEHEIRRLEKERERFVQAVAMGGELEGLVCALRDRETRLTGLREEFEALRATEQSVRHFDARRVREELHELARNWRDVLSGEPVHARPVLSKLLVGRVTFTPLEGKKRWELRGRGTISGLFRENLSLPFPREG